MEVRFKGTELEGGGAAGMTAGLRAGPASANIITLSVCDLIHRLELYFRIIYIINL